MPSSLCFTAVPSLLPISPFPSVRASRYNLFVRRAPHPFRRRTRSIPLVVTTNVRRSLPSAALSALPGLIDPVVLRSAISAITRLMTTLLFGVAAAKRGLLDPATLMALSKSVFNIFLPALLFSNIIITLSAGAPSGGLFFLPLAAVAQIFFSLILGVIGAFVLRLNDPERRVFTVCCGFGNSAALPLLFANALFAGQPGNLAAMISAISFFLIGWTGFFWSIGYSILAGLPDPNTPFIKPQIREKKTFRTLLNTGAKRIISPPLIAAMLGLAIGLSPVCAAFMASPAFSALQTLGAGYSPAAVLILAGSLARKIQPRVTNESDAQTPVLSLRLRRLALGISFCRYIIMPIFGVLAIRSFPVFNTPFVKLALLLETIMPPAQNSTLILNLENKPDAAASMARILLAVYLIGVVPMSIGLTYFLGFAGV